MPKSTKKEVQERRQKILSDLLEGKSKKNILQEVSESADITVHQVSKDLEAIENQIGKFRDSELLNILNLHLIRYEEIYLFYTNEMPDQSMAMQALNAKESLMGLHKPEMNMQVNNNEKVIEHQDYNVGKLAPQEQQRLEILLSKCKK